MFVISCGIYPIDIAVSIGESKKKLCKELSKTLPKYIIEDLKDQDFEEGKSAIFPTNQVLLWLKNKPSSIEELAILNHEIFHCTCFILERLGITYSESSDEAYAYLIQYLTNKIYSNLNITFS